ncbi:hypothetical protein [Streptomyces sp. NPDC096153]|uniref:hypothetical protein n=1 Tax=Streptomyces sp. NPDC096153 TaxID=3155548 RepID=UPI00331DBAB2
MNRSDTFLISHKPFAIDLSTVELHISAHRDDRWWLSGTCRAVWYRRKAGETRACLGRVMLHAAYLRTEPDLSSPEAMLSNDLDGRYGGDTEGRWDGEYYWGAQRPETIEQHLAVLRPMMANFPVIPDGFDGWWRFQ